MKFLNLPIAAAVIMLGFSPLQAFAGETQASTSSQFGGEGQSTSQNTSNATMSNDRAWSGDQNAWGRGGAGSIMPVIDNTPTTNSNTNTGPNKLAPVTNYVDPNNIKGTFMDRAPNCYYPSGGGGVGGGSSGAMNTYTWSKSAKSAGYKPFSSTPPPGWGAPTAGKHKAH